MEAAAPILRLQARGVCKTYAVPVLAEFDFDLAPGEVHALVGSNGAGKSTFAHILSGLVTADSGAILLDGRPHAPRTLAEAQARGVVLVQQELNILPTLSVAENLFLDRLPHRFGTVQRAALHAQARAAMQRVGLGQLDVAAPAGTLAYSWKLKDRRELQANLVVTNLLNDRGPLYFNSTLRPKGGDYTSPARETVLDQFALKKPINYNLSLTLKL